MPQCSICKERESLTSFCKDCTKLLRCQSQQIQRCTKCKRLSRCDNISGILQHPLWKCNSCLTSTGVHIGIDYLQWRELKQRQKT